MSNETPPRAENGSDVTAALLARLGDRFAAFMSSLTRPVVFFDIEATGTDPMSDRIVELSVVRVEPPPVGLLPPRTWRINPEVRIPTEASEIHGIVNEDLMASPTFASLVPELVEVFEGADLAGFSVGRFDVRILAAELARAGSSLDLSASRVIDAQVIYHQREPRNLAAALRFYCGRELVDAHGAEADTIAALEVFAGQLERYPDLPLDVDALDDESSAHNDAYCDGQRRFMWRDNEPVFNFGRMRGKSLRVIASDPIERKYLRWFLEGSFDEDAKGIVRDALQGRIRRRATSRRRAG
ncbi:3'-5' exonuclease [Paraliomyxa miuraensis]|uniref:3'-5' exonuclease n=1 Tax=Paraliomyxa miuraensis TaxID=376150 RepID=UPI00225A4D1C|nr:3'-5' exonuclease [Paraliomyxa miuraensis]MCX4247213.1 3'-5' exonuclease [Paraliomyxa miuraensis]